MTGLVFTIGHSTHPLDHFAGLLRQHSIEVVGDVRSTPYSRMNPQYNRENLQRSLTTLGLTYVYLGRELGARPENPECYVSDRVDYELVARTPLFQGGLDRVVNGIGQYRVALMCAERDPGSCHRTLLVSRHLGLRGVTVQHILADGRLESQASVLDRLREQHGLPEKDLFRSPEDVLAEVYRRSAM